MTRTVPNGKGYNRKKMKQDDYRSGRLSQCDRDGLPLLTDCIVNAANSGLRSGGGVCGAIGESDADGNVSAGEYGIGGHLCYL